jgi:hypothetical protein
VHRVGYLTEIKKQSFGVNTTIELKDITTTSENTGTLLSQNVARQMPLLPDLITFFSSFVVSTANEQFLDCATIANSERHNISWGKGGGSFMRNQSKQRQKSIKKHKSTE